MTKLKHSESAGSLGELWEVGEPRLKGENPCICADLLSNVTICCMYKPSSLMYLLLGHMLWLWRFPIAAAEEDLNFGVHQQWWCIDDKESEKSDRGSVAGMCRGGRKNF